MMICREFLVLSLVLNIQIMKSFARHHPHRTQLTEMPNKYRYAKIFGSPSANEQIINYFGARQGFNQGANKYHIKRGDLRETETVSTGFGVLDKEDRFLLDKFYSGSKDGVVDRLHNSAPFFDDVIPNKKPSTEEHLSKVLLNSSRWHEFKPSTLPELFASVIEPISHGNWTIDPHLLSLVQVRSPLSAFNYDIPSLTTTSSGGVANYSPVHRLLTSYDPIEEQLRASMDTDQERGGRVNRVSGATLYGRTQSSEPMLSSKSAERAVKLHDEMFENPPRDGIARVRMYFHRAIHDDAKLYGTGPWKYWGHGWGVEYGFDPKNLKNPSLYQKGYTIERGYGRDFCKDKKNCRAPDPDFFKGMPNVGR